MKFIRLLKHDSDQVQAFVVGSIAAFAVIVKRLRWIPVAAALGLVPIAQSANAQDDITDDEVWLVDGIDGDDMNNGKDSWANAREMIQSVLTDGDLEPGDRIWVRATTYTLSSATDTFLLEDGVWLLGGFDTGDTERTDADPYVNETILDGDNTAYHVVTAIELEASGPPAFFTRLDGFIIEGGSAATAADHPRGGGLIMRSDDEDPTTTNFWLKASRCRFRNNDAALGGAVYRPFDGSANSGHHLELTNCEFIGNEAFDGGAVWTFGGELTINNSLFHNNLAGNNGGAIALAQTCLNDPENCDSGCVTLQASVVTVNSCTLSKNHANGEGGGIYARRFMDLDITSSILWANTDDSSATDTVEKAQIVREFFCMGALEEVFGTATDSCIEDLDIYAATGNTGNIGADPLFAGAGSGNYRLGSGSPCVDAGDVGFGFPQDDLDFDHDTNTNELAPDGRARHPRVISGMCWILSGRAGWRCRLFLRGENDRARFPVRRFSWIQGTQKEPYSCFVHSDHHEGFAASVFLQASRWPAPSTPRTFTCPVISPPSPSPSTMHRTATPSSSRQGRIRRRSTSGPRRSR